MNIYNCIFKLLFLDVPVSKPSVEYKNSSPTQGTVILFSLLTIFAKFILQLSYYEWGKISVYS